MEQSIQTPTFKMKLYSFDCLHTTLIKLQDDQRMVFVYSITSMLLITYSLGATYCTIQWNISYQRLGRAIKETILSADLLKSLYWGNLQKAVNMSKRFPSNTLRKASTNNKVLNILSDCKPLGCQLTVCVPFRLGAFNCQFIWRL